MKIILASTSVYRRELLGRLRLPFAVEAPGVDEQSLAGETPRQMAIRLAQEKALAVAQRHVDALVIGSDQTASLDGVNVIGKPGSHERARAQLRAASGRTLTFHSAMCVTHLGRTLTESICVDTRVRFRPLSEPEIEQYLLAEKPYDCAGSAKSEGLGISLLEAIEGPDPTALVGLPLIELSRLLRQAGVVIPAISASA
jgi:septum formation protein